MDMKVEVECYAGRKADERPVRFRLDEREYTVEEVVDSWYGSEHVFFKVRADDGGLYILRHETSVPDGEWSWCRFAGPVVADLASGEKFGAAGRGVMLGAHTVSHPSRLEAAMPRYEFYCEDCQERFEIILTLTEYEEGKVTCTKCCGKHVHQEAAEFFAVNAKKS